MTTPDKPAADTGETPEDQPQSAPADDNGADAAASGASVAAAEPPTEKKPLTIRRVTRELMGFLWPYRKQFVLAMLAALVYAAASNGRILLLKPLVDNVFFTDVGGSAGRLDHLQFIVGIVLLITLVAGPAAFFRQYIGSWITQRLAIDLQRHIHQHMMKLDMGFYIRHRHGDLMSRVMGDMGGVMRMLEFTAVQFPVHFFLLLTGIAVAIVASWKLALLCVVMMPPLALFLDWMGKKVRKWSRQAGDARGEVMNRLNDGMVGIRVVKSFRREEREVERFKEASEGVLARAMKSVKYETLNSSGIDIVYNLLIAGLVFIGGWMVLEGTLTSGELVMFIAAMVAAYDPVRRLSRAINMYQNSMAAAERVFEVLDIDPSIQDAPDAVEHDRFESSVEFSGINFSYADAAKRSGELTYDSMTADGRTPGEVLGELESFRLHDVSFTAKKGEVIALVGERGSGKSTLLDLLLRIYDPGSGAVKIDGIDVRKIKRDSLRKLFAVVTQETFLFHTTIAENIAYARPDASRESIRRAAADANIEEFIDRQPQGLDTVVGSRGARLSGGERQSHAIARALLADAPILLLDEATSNLDSVSERRIQNALERLMEQRTVFVVAHRLSTIQHANRIIVMQHGRIAETGTHDELLAKGGLYRTLHDTQFRLNETSKPAETADTE